MKRLYAIFILLVLLTGVAGAEYSSTLNEKGILNTFTGKVYDTKDEFVKAEAGICKLATDGCNNVMINNGELGGMTMMYCEDIYGVNGKEAWSCKEYVSSENQPVYDGLTNDERFHQHLKNILGKVYQEQVAKSVDFFEGKTKNYTDKQFNSAVDLLNGVLGDVVFSLINAYPADKALPELVNNQYLMLTLLKFELLELKK